MTALQSPTPTYPVTLKVIEEIKWENEPTNLDKNIAKVAQERIHKPAPHTPKKFSSRTTVTYRT